MNNTDDIQNFLYPRQNMPEDEIERLDGVLLLDGEEQGYLILDGKEYYFTRRCGPEYFRDGRGMCSFVRYHWNYRPTTYKQDGWRAAGYSGASR